jgi:hypothetical protein
MEKQKFNEEIVRLKSVYGEKSYPPERISLIWREFYYISDKDFLSAVDQLISNKRFAPMVDDFRGILSGQTRSNRLEKIDAIKKSSYCKLCGNTGSLAVNKLERRCTCALGEPGLMFPEYLKRAV